MLDLVRKNVLFIFKILICQYRSSAFDGCFFAVTCPLTVCQDKLTLCGISIDGVHLILFDFCQSGILLMWKILKSEKY